MRLLLMTLMIWGLGCAKYLVDQRQIWQYPTPGGGKKDALEIFTQVLKNQLKEED